MCCMARLIERYLEFLLYCIFRVSPILYLFHTSSLEGTEILNSQIFSRCRINFVVYEL
jgi:hypothetical protein